MKALIIKTKACGLEVYDLYYAKVYVGRFMSEQGARDKANRLEGVK